MKKTILTIMIIIIILFSSLIVIKQLDNKAKRKQDIETNKEDLQSIENIIINKIQKLDNYKNMASICIGEDKIIIELIDNSEEEEKWFRDNIYDSKALVFEQGGPYSTSENKLNFVLEKKEDREFKDFNEYYKDDNRTIYIADNLKELYIIDNNYQKTNYKNYLSNKTSIDDGIKELTDNLKVKLTSKDGGSKLYNSKEKDIAMIVCNNLNGNKDIYIGDYSLKFDMNYCS